MLVLVLAASLASPALADDPPVALAGVPFLAYPGERIVLDGSQSYDPEGYDLDFTWTQLHGPETLLRNDDTPNPDFDAEWPGTYSFVLVVHDGLQASDPDIVDVIVVDPAIGGDIEVGGCAAATGRGGRLLLLPGLLAIARRRRR